jgi:hypothetical protein
LLENEFGKPVVCNQTAAVREMMILLNGWKPLQGRGRVRGTGVTAAAGAATVRR